MPSNVGATIAVQGIVILRGMDVSSSKHALTALDLRYLLTVHLLEAEHSLSISELVALVESDGFALPGRASKTLSDALRWEIRRGRVVRVRRATYRAGFMPRQTKSHIRRRVRDVRSGVTPPPGAFADALTIDAARLQIVIGDVATRNL